MAPDGSSRASDDDVEHDERLMRPDGQRYQAPEPDETLTSKSWAYAALGLLVVVLLLLMATGVVPIFPR